MIGLAKLLDISWTTRVTRKDTRTFMPIIHITKEKAREETKGKVKTKARKAEIEQKVEEERHLAILATTIVGILIASKNPLIKTINLHSHHAMMDYVGIVTNLGTSKEIAGTG